VVYVSLGAGTFVVGTVRGSSRFLVDFPLERYELYAHNFLLTNAPHIPANFPIQPFLQILEIVMKINIFAFQDSHWLQLSGTAMGTPAACAYATLTYGHYKNTVILPTYNSNLLYYRRYVDDKFGIWIPSATDNLQAWESFKKSLNNWVKLEWLIEEPSQATNFLDLTLHISNSKIETKMFQKPMNLYLYIPAGLAHPPSCLKGLIIGETQRYGLQKSMSLKQSSRSSCNAS